ncbi:DNA methylase [Clostridium sp. USBA 49]|jgi:DNA modification methylase|uniref:TRM11 family SAM-dependent methyltransferase n=1 Tax=Clostridium TaxID=1485 RepID=UPI00099A9784|nr:MULTISPECIES: DNA methyltransferase [Clostridium]SKA86414.1 DNA methylase [Clostridium sp. USBA 49]
MSEKFKLETTTIWSFKDRGNYSTHKGDYPGNWSPYVPRNIILRYSNKNDVVLDQFVGSGTTLIECRLLNRIGIGCDINENALKKSLERTKNIEANNKTILLKRDARNLFGIKDNSIDLICTHPPYSNIIRYSKAIDEDLSLLEYDNFLIEMVKVARECYRVLKKGKYCAILIADIRKNGYIKPLGYEVMNIFINQRFKLKEIIIKEQHNCSKTDYWREISVKRNFYLIAHEYLFIFQK